MAEQLVSVQVNGNNRCIVPWSVVTVDPRSSFDDLLKSMKAGKYSIVSPSEFLLRAIISSVSVGKDKQSMSIVGKEMNVCDVCRSFGSYVRLQVEEDQPRTPTTTAHDAFVVLMANQRMLRSPTLPDRLSERTKKDKLYTDLISRWHGVEVAERRSQLRQVIFNHIDQCSLVY